jgi:hypothetical protein
MGELAKAIVRALLVNQSVAVGSKVISNKRVTAREKESLGLALVAYALVHLATSTTTPNTSAKQ